MAINKNIHLGIIIPASNITAERELCSFIYSVDDLKNRIFLHFARAGFETRYRVSKKKYLTEVVESIPLELKKLSKIEQLLGVSFLCTSGTLFFEKREDIKRQCFSIYKKPLVTPVESLINGLSKMKVRKPLLITPYSKEIDKEFDDLFKGSGIYPKKVISLNLDTSSKLIEFSENKLYLLLKEELKRGTYDGVSIMCTNFPTLNILDSVEKEWGIPVISSNQATIYELLKDVIAPSQISDFGKLFSYNEKF